MKIFLVNHPAKEAHYNRRAKGETVYVPWNPGPSHHRKFIERGGLCLTCDNKLVQDTLRFWGEYEPNSEATIINEEVAPLAVHKKLYPVGQDNIIPESSNGCCLNTDPYVYGDEFYSYCCKRHHNEYEPGDIILFGTVMGKNMQFFADTVFVVKGPRPVNSFPQNENYWKCSLDPRLYKNGLPPYDTVLVGRRYSENQTEFCFVPCVSSNNTAVKAPFKPAIDVMKYEFPQIKSYFYNPEPVQLQASPFPSIIADIRRQSFDIATYIDCI